MSAAKSQIVLTLVTLDAVVLAFYFVLEYGGFRQGVGQTACESQP